MVARRRGIDIRRREFPLEAAVPGTWSRRGDGILQMPILVTEECDVTGRNIQRGGKGPS